MLFDRTNWPPHRPWFLLFLAGTLGAAAWYVYEAGTASTWPGGSSRVGFWCGVALGVLCLFEFFLWIRKKYLRVWRIGRAQTWLRAHIWLGLLCVPLLFFHSGFRLGGPLAATLFVLLLLIVLSGLVGLVLQQVLPKRMLDELSAETIYSQIGELSRQLEAEAEDLVTAVCGLETEEEAAEASSRTTDAGFLVVGAVRQVGMIAGRSTGTRAVDRRVAGAEPLAEFFRAEIVPFLRQGADGNLPLAHAGRARSLFANLRTRVPAAAHTHVDTLESFCEQRRQWIRQERAHFWLHSWLWIHFPLSVALILLMFVHVFVALKYY